MSTAAPMTRRRTSLDPARGVSIGLVAGLAIWAVALFCLARIVGVL